MTVKGGTSQACAACKYQRRKCAPDCPLAPYFPPDQPKLFQNAHRLFGVSNILKILSRLDSPQKAEAMRSMTYQANMRERYPVHGCLGIIYTLHYQINQCHLELDAVNTQLAYYRRCHHQQQQHQLLDAAASSPPPSSTSSPIATQLQLATNENAAAAAAAANNNNLHLLPLFMGNTAFDAAALSQANEMMNDDDGNDSPSLWAQNSYGNTPTAAAALASEAEFLHGLLAGGGPHPGPNERAQTSVVVSSMSPPVTATAAGADEYDEMISSPFFDTIIDDDCREPHESSSPESSSLKDTIQSTAENISKSELKSAAACFSLTNVKG